MMPGWSRRQRILVILAVGAVAILTTVAVQVFAPGEEPDDLHEWERAPLFDVGSDVGGELRRELSRCRFGEGFLREAAAGCFLWFDGGSFLMGAQATRPSGAGYDPHARPQEGPPRSVTVGGFWVQAAEVQVDAYRTCVEAGACPEPVFSERGFYRYAAGQAGSMNGVTWGEAQAYCAQLGGRLPTEAEWEYLARGTDDWRFPWGDELRCPEESELADFDLLRAGPVGAKVELGSEKEQSVLSRVDCRLDEPPRYVPHLEGLAEDEEDRVLPNPSTCNDLGLCQLGGGLWEWVGDYFHPDYYRNAPDRDPPGPQRGTRRVQRGGGWLSSSILEFRSAGRASLDPELRMPDVGFRCVAHSLDPPYGLRAAPPVAPPGS
jgi:formylglycine-generating enzyme required for sulfatase activity